jgi:hypothetical protein
MPSESPAEPWGLPANLRRPERIVESPARVERAAQRFAALRAAGSEIDIAMQDKLGCVRPHRENYHPDDGAAIDT